MIKYGLYEHYKGNYYEVFTVAKHTETNELLVIYRSFPKKDDNIYARPETSFFEIIDIDNNIPRFRKLDKEEQSLIMIGEFFK